MTMWLPLQGVAAVVMPFCKHSLAGSTGAVDERQGAAHEHHPAARAGHEGMAHDDSPGLAPAIVACDDCGQCHLSCAFTLPSPGLASTDSASFAAPSFTPALPHGTAPHPLHRPPLPALI
jgi:hypothetical protein